MRVGSDAAPAAGRKRNLSHSGGAGAPPGGQYELPARSMAIRGPKPPACAFAKCAKPAREERTAPAKCGPAL